jgi:hypothetical protein
MREFAVRLAPHSVALAVGIRQPGPRAVGGDVGRQSATRPSDLHPPHTLICG